MSSDIDASERMIDNWTRQIQERAERYQAMAERFQDLSVTERSPDGTIELTVSSKGMLTDLRISEAAGGQRMAEVSAQIMRTLQRAQSKIPELLQGVMADTVGLQDESASHMINEAIKTFPEPPADDEEAATAQPLSFDDDPDETEPAPPPPPSNPRPHRPARRDDGDDDELGSIYS